MNILDLRDHLIEDYSICVRIFVNARDERIGSRVGEDLAGRLIWPLPRIALNPDFEPGEKVDKLIDQGAPARGMSPGPPVRGICRTTSTSRNEHPKAGGRSS